MAIKSQYKNKCKDCGTEYQIGDMIDTNGKQSPNKSGEMKDHWCKNGKNCQGTQQGQFTSGPDPNMVCIHDKEPTTAELRKNWNALSEDKKVKFTYAIIDDYIKQREACEDVGITKAVTIGMIWNNKVRDRQ